jgi:hypothetical protein
LGKDAMTDCREFFFIVLSIFITYAFYFSPFPMAVIKGCCSKYLVLLRSSGFLRKQQSTKFISSLLPLLSLGA